LSPAERAAIVARQDVGIATKAAWDREITAMVQAHSCVA
jgi:hypothetical protein